MAGIPLRKFVPSNLSREQGPWGREVEDRIKALEKAAARGDASSLNTNKAQNSSIDLVSRNIVDLDTRLTELLQTVTIDSSQVVSGILNPARIPNIPQTTVTGTWDKAVSTAGTITGSAVTGTQVYAPSAQFNNITASRTATWIRDSDGLVGTATSSRIKKTNIRDVEWPEEKLEAIMQMALVYYEWIAAVELEKYIASLPEDHPRYGEAVPVHQEVGFIAEEMHAKGLWEFVAYRRHREDDSLVLKNGKPIPFSIHYPMWSLALHAVVQRLWADRKKDRTDIDRALSALGLAPTE